MFNARKDKIIAELKNDIEDLQIENFKLNQMIRNQKDTSSDYSKLSRLLRSELGMVNIEQIDFTHKLPGEKDPLHYFYGKTQEQIKQILAAAYTINETPIFRELCQYLINETGNYLALASRSHEEDMLSRGEMLGTAKVLQEFGALAAQHEAMVTPGVEYDDKEIL